MDTTDRQQEYLDFMRRFQRERRRPPTFREIAIAMEVSSKGTISDMMMALEGKKRKPRKRIRSSPARAG